MNEGSLATTWAAVFDVDGTMVDNRRVHEAAWLELAQRRGMAITPDFYRQRMHSRSNTEIGHLLLGADADGDAIAALSGEKEAIYRERYRPKLREVAGLSMLLAELAEAGVPCAVVSNSPPANVAMVIDGLQIRRYFRCVIDYTQVARGKPDPQLLQAAASQLGVPIERCLVLEDSVSGFAAAEAAGAPYVVVTAGADPAELCRAEQAVAVVVDFTELSVERMARWVECRA
jgi:HAD superfamily hydrolase (TIGR01509 family)